MMDDPDVNETYDLLIIGGGSAGLTAAGFAIRLGMRVALVEKHRLERWSARSARAGAKTMTGPGPTVGRLSPTRDINTTDPF